MRNMVKGFVTAGLALAILAAGSPCSAQGPVTKFSRALANLVWSPLELLHGAATGLAQGDLFGGMPRGLGKGSQWALAYTASSVADLATLPVPVETWTYQGPGRREALFPAQGGSPID